jgi:hypothetical protein
MASARSRKSLSAEEILAESVVMRKEMMIIMFTKS